MSRNSAGASSQSHFARIPSANIQRSGFDRSSTHKTTFSAGQLIPFFADEILPGDSCKLSTNILCRLATPIFPYMDNVYLDVHYFFVPNRLVWTNWERMNGAQDDPGDSTDFLSPQLDATTHAAGFGELSLYDYLGLPTKVPSIPQADMPNAYILRAYNLIFNEWYRDENLQDSVLVPKDNGPDTVAYSVLKRGRRKDYFTSALPWPQKGPAVELPIGAAAPVYRVPNAPLPWRWMDVGTNDVRTTANDVENAAAGKIIINTAPVDGNFDPQDGLYADLNEATAATINMLRQAFQLQRMFERDARGGTRYVEILLSHFGVVSPDFRLQRPEYLGGGTLNINVNSIAQTSETTNDSPQGNLSAFAVGSGRMGFYHSFVEHGHVLGILSVRADTTYQQGLNKMWSRRTRYDFYWPTLAHLGEQPVFNKEIYMTGGASDNLIWGYQERYAEYRYKPSIVTGRFRSNSSVPLDAWHLAVDFDSLPTLAGFVEENPPIPRIIEVQSEPQFILDSYTNNKHFRPMPTYSVPGHIDHF